MPLSPATLEEALRAFEDFVREKRLKMTGQRRTMIRAALEHTGHFTAENLYQELSRGGEQVSMATVYRGLALLEEADLLHSHNFADGQRRYERALDREHHDHMICTDCRAVIEFTNEQIESLQDEIVSSHGFTMQDHSLTLFVRCNTFREQGRCDRRDKKLARQKRSTR